MKQILLTLIGLVALGNLCSSLATDYLPLLLCRFVAGLPMGRSTARERWWPEGLPMKEEATVPWRWS